jgi:hypothetical protein
MLLLLEGHLALPIHGLSDAQQMRGLDTLPNGSRIEAGQAW